MERVGKVEKREIVKMLFEKYRTINLSRKQASEVLNISTATLDRMRNRGEGPNYLKTDPGSRNGKVLYPLENLVDYIQAKQILCA